MRAIGRGVAAVLLVGGLTLGAGTPARADEGLGARLEALERMLKEQAAELARLRAELAQQRGAPAPPPAPPSAEEASPATCGVGPAGLPAAPPPPGAGSVAARPQAQSDLLAGAPSRGLRWGGYGTIEYVAPSDANSHFDLHRLVLTFDAPITRCLDFYGEVEFEHGGIGGPLDGEVIVEQAEFLFRLSDAFRPKAGALLVPFGRTNLYHDDPLHDFTLRPWTGRFLVPTGWGVPGVGAEGDVPLGCHVFSYDVVANNGVKDAFSASSGIRPARQDWEADNNENKQVWGRASMAWRVPGFARLETGVSGTFGQYDDAGQNDLSGFAVDLLARAGPFEVKGEYIDYSLERDALDPVGSIEGLNGLWVEAAYHFMPCAWRRACTCLVEPTSHFTLAARYMQTDLHDRVRGAAFRDDLESWGVALNYRLTEATVIRVDHTWFEPVVGPDTHELTVSLSTYF